MCVAEKQSPIDFLGDAGVGGLLEPGLQCTAWHPCSRNEIVMRPSFFAISEGCFQYFDNYDRRSFTVYVGVECAKTATVAEVKTMGSVQV